MAASTIAHHSTLDGALALLEGLDLTTTETSSDMLMEASRRVMDLNRALADAERTIRDRERAAIDERLLCPVCLDREKNLAFGCGHRVCDVCAEQLLHECPTCRSPITVRTRLF